MSKANEVERLLVPDEASGGRLDLFLAARYPDISRTQLQRMVRSGAVRLNGVPAKPADTVAPGDRISLCFEQAPEPQVLANPSVELGVLHSDGHVVVVDKRAGQVVHPAAGHMGDTLVNGLLARFPALADEFAGDRPGIVHRLDRDTSGVMVVALTQSAATSLRAQFKARSVEKRYVALVQGRVEPPQGIVDAPIGRDPAHRKRMAAVAGGRPARTIYRSMAATGDYSWLELTPKTGRTHQIRVHLSAIGHPVVGDEVYGRRDPLIGRTALHALRLSFEHPETGERVSFTAPLPQDLQEALEALGIDNR